MQDLFRIKSILTAALECSIYIDPGAPGLADPELNEVARRLGLQDGEINDASRLGFRCAVLNKRLVPEQDAVPAWSSSGFMDDSGQLNLQAFKHIRNELREAQRAFGATRARVRRELLIARGEHNGLLAHDLKVAITAQLLSGRLTETNEGIGYKDPPIYFSDEGESRHPPRQVNSEKLKVLEVVRDVVRRRDGELALSIEPLDAFAERLAGLGYGPFKLWWQRTVSELHYCDEKATPVAITVLAAALVEGALTFIVKHARKLDLGTLSSKDFERPEYTWKIDDLVKSSAFGQGDAVLSDSDRRRAEQLIRSRQQIHAGRMLTEYPQGVPDFRPEEARDAKAIADLVVRRILEWLDRHSANSA